MTCDPMLSDKDTTHSYLPIYRHLFAPYRKGKNGILEIGVCAGGSLLMWRNYFSGKVVGVDVAECPPPITKDHCIQHIQSNAYSTNIVHDLKSIGPFDVIVEDGTHYQGDMEFVCSHYPQLLAPGGLLVLEDVQDMSWLPSMIFKLPTGWFSAVIDLRHVKGRYDDVLLCVWRPME